MEKKSSDISNELECQICLDLLIEPVTTLCGHTFCKICLIKFLKTKSSCAICRKPILQSIDSLTKNIGMENILKQLHPDEYAEKLKARKILYEQEKQEVSQDDTFRDNLPCIIIENAKIYPNQILSIPINQSTYLRTIMFSAGSDRIMVISPSLNFNDSTVSFLVEIQSLNRPETGLVGSANEMNNLETPNNQILLALKGLKRFKLTSNPLRNIVENMQEDPIFVGSGNIIVDNNLSNENEKRYVYENLLKLTEVHNDLILSKVSYLFKRKLVQQYGELPKLPDYNNSKMTHYESLSFYFLNLLRNNNKHIYFTTTNIVERIEWIISQYTNFLKLDLNPNSAIEFYDIEITGRPENNTKVTILMFLAIMFFFIAYKYRYIEM